MPGASVSEEFHLYLDAVNKSADRTRSVLYIVLLVLVAVFFAELNTRPGNDAEARFETMIAALACVQDGKTAETVGKGDPCETPLSYARERHFDFAQAGSAKDSVAFKAAEKRIQDLMRRELDTHVITIPVLGIAIDANDFWIVAGPVMVFLMLILNASLVREQDNLARAAARATTAHHRELLVMAQLFADPKDHLPFNFVLLLPAALYGWELYLDMSTWAVEEILHGPSGLVGAVETASSIPIVWLSVRCVLAARGISGLVRKLEQAVPEPAG